MQDCQEAQQENGDQSAGHQPDEKVCGKGNKKGNLSVPPPQVELPPPALEETRNGLMLLDL